MRGPVERWSPDTEILLFTAARRDHLERTIRPALDRGDTVISDRFADSTRVYQGLVRADLRRTVDALHALAVGVEPDLTLILDLDPSLARDRGAARGGDEDRFERFGAAFQARLREGFLALAAEFPGRCRVIPAAGDLRGGRRPRGGGGAVTDEPDRLPGAPHPRETAVLYGQDAAQARFLEAARSGRLHHAWAITGPRGVGKATLAWRIARWLIAGETSPTLDMAPEHPVFRQLAALGSPQLFLCRRPWDDKGERLRTAITVDEVRALKSFFQLTAADARLARRHRRRRRRAERRRRQRAAEDPRGTAGARPPPARLPPPRRAAADDPLPLQRAALLPARRGRAGRGARRRGHGAGSGQAEALAALAGGSVGAAIGSSATTGSRATPRSSTCSAPRRSTAAAPSRSPRAPRGRDPARYALILDLIRLALTRLALAGAGAAVTPVSDAEAEVMARLGATTAQGRLWAGLVPELVARAAHARAVNLDPAQVILDTLLQIDAAAAEARAAA